MQKRTRGWAVFTVVAVVALGSALGRVGLGSRADQRFTAAEQALHDECVMAKVPCRTDHVSKPVLPEYRLAEKDLESARIADRLGRQGDAASSLISVLERADQIDRSRSLIASLMAAKLFDGVSERIDASPALLDDPHLVVAIRRSSFVSARHPLDSERLHAMTVLTTVPAMVPMRTGGFAESTTTQAMTDVSVAMRAMEDGALSGDIHACEAASQSARGLAKQVTNGPSICINARRIVVSAQRLERLQARAASRSNRQHNIKTARVPVSL